MANGIGTAPARTARCAVVASLLAIPLAGHAQPLPTGREAVASLGLKKPADWQESAPKAEQHRAFIVQPVMPFAFARISSGFGARADPLLGVWRNHGGIDLPGVMGTAIHATHHGIVVQSGAAGGYGLLVKLDHGQGSETLYGHLSALAVPVGAPVFRGQIIGFLGSTGRSTGPHLHFEVRHHGKQADPLLYLTTGWNVPLLRPLEIAATPVHISGFARQKKMTENTSNGGESLPASL